MSTDTLRGQRILITGAGGTIGSEIVRQLWAYQPAQVVILGHGENSIYRCHREALEAGHDPVPVIADVRDRDRLRAIFDQHHLQVVFHAAAHKHVPLMELNPLEAVSNNVLGTQRLLSVCQMFHVKHFVLVSTDKAVNPTSIMGATKRVAELLTLQAGYTAIRLGNVYGSNGSVVDTFLRQIRAGGPVTVTDRAMTRYFLNEGEAGQLAIAAAQMGDATIYLRDMGSPRNVYDLAQRLIALHGNGRNIQVVTTGARPGEKLDETLTYEGETLEMTSIPGIYYIPNAARWVPPCLSYATKQLKWSVRLNDLRHSLYLLQNIVPQYEPSTTLTGVPV